MKAIFAGKVTVVETYPDLYIQAVHLRVPLPAVIALNDQVAAVATRTAPPAFTKRHVFLRDGYTCQYCRRSCAARELSLDHVVPRAAGGTLCWTNVVTCCHACNGRKACYSLDQVRQKFGMTLAGPPRVPTQYELARQAGKLWPRLSSSRLAQAAWRPYLSAVLPPDDGAEAAAATTTTTALPVEDFLSLVGDPKYRVLPSPR
jgi:HNH endonuclease